VKLISACLIGISCRYDGQSRLDNKAIKLLKGEFLIPICPEQLGGLPTPREPSGILSGSGEDVIDGKGKVYNAKGEEVTENFIKGAYEALKLARLYGVRDAILKQRSPSCGCGETQQMKYENGKYMSYPTKGDGVTAALLKRNKIRITTEEAL
jgi:uncharacterized protein YbbK (DUF523 family)